MMQPAQPAPPDREPKIRALVIDDDASVGAAIRAILARHGYATELASRAHAGMRSLELAPFDVVLVDIFIPGMSGLDTISSIRRKVPALPIVAMTGFPPRPSQDPAIDFLGLATARGATACVRKPFTPEQLLGAIAASRSQGPQQQKAAPPCP
ncbi:MAG TPA: response regulator [Rhodopseudomonas sp.]|uniref:response regulator n=1 Tax=Rhodopseudomonas sp. TaxID=1078 RepID=UPI002ED81ED2